MKRAILQNSVSKFTPRCLIGFSPWHSKLLQYLLFTGLEYQGKLPWYFKFDTLGQCYKTFYRGNLLPIPSQYFCITQNESRAWE